MKYLILLVFPIAFFSCSTYSEEDKMSFDKKIQTYLTKNHLEFNKSESGLYFNIVNEGVGDLIQYDDVINVSYKGTLLDGTTFDEQKEAIELSVAEMISGWKEVLLRLKKNGRAQFIVPPQMGYGSYKRKNIPANSPLYFELYIENVQ